MGGCKKLGAVQWIILTVYPAAEILTSAAKLLSIKNSTRNLLTLTIIQESDAIQRTIELKHLEMMVLKIRR